MQKARWLFIGKLVLVTVGGGLGWYWWGRDLYPRMLEPVGKVVLPLLGAHRWHLAWTIDHMANMVPFVALVLATPRLATRWREALRAGAIGLVALIVAHLLMLAGFDHIISRWGLSEITYRWAVPIWVVNDSLPLILWLLLMPDVLGEMFPRLTFKQSGKSVRR